MSEREHMFESTEEYQKITGITLSETATMAWSLARKEQPVEQMVGELCEQMTPEI